LQNLVSSTIEGALTVVDELVRRDVTNRNTGHFGGCEGGGLSTGDEVFSIRKETRLEGALRILYVSCAEAHGVCRVRHNAKLWVFLFSLLFLSHPTPSK
jgi:hypothetical protein